MLPGQARLMTWWWTRRLRSKNYGARKRAAKALAKLTIYTDAAYRPLVTALANDDADVREIACERLSDQAEFSGFNRQVQGEVAQRAISFLLAHIAYYGGPYFVTYRMERRSWARNGADVARDLLWKLDASWETTPAAKDSVATLIDGLRRAVDFVKRRPCWSDRSQDRLADAGLIDILAKIGDQQALPVLLSAARHDSRALDALDRIDPAWHQTTDAQSALADLMQVAGGTMRWHAAYFSHPLVRKIVDALDKIDRGWRDSEDWQREKAYCVAEFLRCGKVAELKELDREWHQMPEARSALDDLMKVTSLQEETIGSDECRQLTDALDKIDRNWRSSETWKACEKDREEERLAREREAREAEEREREAEERARRAAEMAREEQRQKDEVFVARTASLGFGEFLDELRRELPRGSSQSKQLIVAQLDIVEQMWRDIEVGKFRQQEQTVAPLSDSECLTLYRVISDFTKQVGGRPSRVCADIPTDSRKLVLVFLAWWQLIIAEARHLALPIYYAAVDKARLEAVSAAVDTFRTTTGARAVTPSCKFVLWSELADLGRNVWLIGDLNCGANEEPSVLRSVESGLRAVCLRKPSCILAVHEAGVPTAVDVALVQKLLQS